MKKAAPQRAVFFCNLSPTPQTFTHTSSWHRMGISAFWFRRDLRLTDNVGLFHALTSGQQVLPVFIFDKEILDDLPENDARVTFLHQTLTALDAELRQRGSGLWVYYGSPEAAWQEVATQFPITAIFTNHDYEPYAAQRDTQIAEQVGARNITFHTYKDQVIFEKTEVLTDAGKPYSVFTPYSKKWRNQLTEHHLKSYLSEEQGHNFLPFSAEISQKYPFPTLAEMGFSPSAIAFPAATPDAEIIRYYDQKRDFPAQKGTTHIGLHLRFGTISIRKLLKIAQPLNEIYVNELIWREFYMQILWNFPHVVQYPFKREYEGIQWENDERDFEKWKKGETGYPLVDAGMRELNATGYMHNRVRMVVASFLTKHLLIDYRWGEAYFAEKLLDFELASNNGGWQWAAGCGCDAAPYFRVFNPTAQMKKFDPKGQYVRKWVPKFGTPAYPRPIVEHAYARERVLAAYKAALKPSL